MKKMKALSKRGLALLVALLMCVTMLPVSALAAEGETEQLPGTDAIVSDEGDGANAEDSTGDEASTPAGGDNTEAENPGGTEETGGDTGEGEDGDTNEPTPEPEGLHVNYQEEAGTATLTVTGSGTLTGNTMYTTPEGKQEEIFRISDRANQPNQERLSIALKVIADQPGSIMMDARRYANGAKNGLFMNNWQLKSVYLDGVTFPADAGDVSFFRESQIHTVTIINGDVPAKAFDQLGTIRTITLENVQSIGNYAFSKTGTEIISMGGGNYDIKPMLSITGLEGVKAIGCDAFSNSGVTGDLCLDGTTIGDNAFANCKGITSVELKNIQDRDAGLGSKAFGNCTGLTSASLTDVWQMTGTFAGCTGLESLTVTRMDRLIYPFGQNQTTLPNLHSITLIDVRELYTQQKEYSLQVTGAPDLKVTVTQTGDQPVQLKSNAFWRCNASSFELNNITINGTYPFNGVGNRDTQVTVNGGSLGTYAFWNCKAGNVTLKDVPALGMYAFQKCGNLATVTFDNTEGKKTAIGDATSSCYTFQDCDKLTTINGIEHLSLVGGRAFEGTALNTETLDALAASSVILGYSSVFQGNAKLAERMKGILGNQFALELVQTAETLNPAGWASAKSGKENSTEPDTNQITKEAKWANSDKTVADVQLQFSHSNKPGMDFLFVLDLSDSMARIGNEATDSDSRFYSMQSKILDVANKIVEADKTDAEKQYNNQVAFVTFGGYYTEKEPCHIASSPEFTNNPDELTTLNNLSALNQNTDYVAAFTEAKKLVKAHDSTRKLAVIFISDGMPTREGTTTLSSDQATTPNRYSTIRTVAAITQSFEKQGVNVFGVMQSVPDNEKAWADYAMKEICTDGLVFDAKSTKEFSEAVNKAIGAAYGVYTVTDTVGDGFELDVNSIRAPEGTEVKVSEDGRTITWTIYGVPFTTYTLSFQENLKQVNGAYPYGTFDTNKGDATVTGAHANAVAPPQLTREQPYVPPYTPDPTPGTPVNPPATTYTVTYVDGVEDEVVFADQVNPGLAAGTATPDFRGEPEREGYTFMGWSPEVSPTVTRSITYVAQWEPEEEIDEPDVPLVVAPGLDTVNHFAYIIGYGGSEVRPGGNITRSEVATIFFRLMEESFRNTHWSKTNSFTDITPQDWYNNAVSTCVGAELVNGYADGTFRGRNNITRAEFAAIAARFLSDEATIESPFTDISGHWAEKEILKAAEAGWIQGYADGTFRPNNYITRAEAMTLVNRMINRVPKAEDMLGEDEGMVKWVDNNPGDWWYEAVQEATNSHDYEMGDREDGSGEVWTGMLPNRNWAALEKEWSEANSGSDGNDVM